jgi:hypothetical protein
MAARGGYPGHRRGENTLVLPSSSRSVQWRPGVARAPSWSPGDCNTAGLRPGLPPSPALPPCVSPPAARHASLAPPLNLQATDEAEFLYNSFMASLSTAPVPFNGQYGHWHSLTAGAVRSKGLTVVALLVPPCAGHLLMTFVAALRLPAAACCTHRPSPRVRCAAAAAAAPRSQHAGVGHCGQPDAAADGAAVRIVRAPLPHQLRRNARVKVGWVGCGGGGVQAPHARVGRAAADVCSPCTYLQFNHVVF